MSSGLMNTKAPYPANGCGVFFGYFLKKCDLTVCFRVYIGEALLIMRKEKEL